MPTMRPQELLIILVIILILFGGSMLPKLARNLGTAKRELDEGLNQMDDRHAASS